MHISLYNLHGCMSRRRLFSPQSRLDLPSAMGAHGPWPQKSSSSSSSSNENSYSSSSGQVCALHWCWAGRPPGPESSSFVLALNCPDDKAPYSTY